jgi:nucleoside-diphosphate kinase
MERSLFLVKPDAVKRNLGGTILSRIENLGLKMVALRMLREDEALANKHYSVHKGKPFFNGLVAYITSGPIIAAVFEGEKTVEKIRQAMGATDPAKAAKGTIRADFGLNIENNAVHGSDSVENAKIEISLFFSESEIYS